MCKLSGSSETSSQTAAEPKPLDAEADFPSLASSIAKSKKARTRTQKMQSRRPEEASVSLPRLEEATAEIQGQEEEHVTTDFGDLKANCPPSAIAQMPHPMQALMTRLMSSSDTTHFTSYLSEETKQFLSNEPQQAEDYAHDGSCQPYEDHEGSQATCTPLDVCDRESHWSTCQGAVHPETTYLITYDEGYTWWPWVPDGTTEVCAQVYAIVPVPICSYPSDTPSEQCTQESEATQGEYYQELACTDIMDISQIKWNVWKLSRSPDGTRCVQEAFESATLSTDEKLELALEFQGHVFEASRCRHANHALQKCISMLPAENIQFIVDEIALRKGGAVQIAKNQCGCRIIQRLLEHCSPEQMREIIEELVSHTETLSTNQFGNFVVSHIFQFCDVNIAQRVVEKLLEVVKQLEAPGNFRDEGSQGGHDEGARGRLGSVLDTAFNSLQQEILLKLANEVVSRKEFFADLACSRFGHKAALKAFNFADATVQHTALIALRGYAGKLRNRYGKPLLKMVEEYQSWGVRRPAH